MYHISRRGLGYLKMACLPFLAFFIVPSDYLDDAAANKVHSQNVEDFKENKTKRGLLEGTDAISGGEVSPYWRRTPT